MKLFLLALYFLSLSTASANCERWLWEAQQTPAQFFQRVVFKDQKRLLWTPEIARQLGLPTEITQKTMDLPKLKWEQTSYAKETWKVEWPHAADHNSFTDYTIKVRFGKVSKAQFNMLKAYYNTNHQQA